MTNLNTATALLEKLTTVTKAAHLANRYEDCPVWALNGTTERAYIARAWHAGQRDRTPEILKACADEGIVFPESFDYRDLVTYIDVAVEDGAEEWAEEFAAELAALEAATAA